MGKAGVTGFFFFIVGIIIMVVAGDAHGAVFFTGVGLFFIGIMIWIFMAVWGISTVVDNKTRDWLND